MTDVLTPGQKVQLERELKGWSQRFLASRAGVSHTTIRRIEAGEQGTDNRYLMGQIATALEIPLRELWGVPSVYGDRELEAAPGRVMAVRSAFIDTDLDEDPGHEPASMEALERTTELVCALRAGCDYTGAAGYLPALIRDLHVHAHRPHWREALVLLTRASYAALFTLRSLGYPGEAYIAAQRAQAAARQGEDPVLAAAGAFAAAHAAAQNNAYGRALTITTRALDAPGANLPAALPAAGMLTLTAALAAGGTGDVDAADAYLELAAGMAARTGETSDPLGQNFGPVNVELWRLQVRVDTGRAGLALEAARRVQPGEVRSKSRIAAYYIDSARAHAHTARGRDTARQLLLASDRAAPQHTRMSHAARELTRSLLGEYRREAGGPDLRSLAERMHVRA